MSKPLKILVELTITDPKIDIDGAGVRQKLKQDVEERINRGAALAEYCWSLGTYHDAEVVQLSKKKVFDVRQ
jgi:hypothetical protein